MDPVDINTVLGIALGYLVAQGLRWLSRTRFWSNVRARAATVLQDPTIPVDDPREAAERALVDAQRPQLDAVARKLSSSIPPLTKAGGDNNGNSDSTQ